jgi:P27 family predicted phage terminase small subunit
MLQLEEIVSRDGLLVPGHRSMLRRHPVLPALAQARDAVRTFASDFGMSPVARSRMSVPKAPEDDDWGGILP